MTNATSSRNRRGFSLIELLVVVSVIAILAGIALPNFLEAQTRSKVSRAKADMRTIATALEAYSVDHNKYPPSTLIPLFLRLRPLTTPVAYLTSIPSDIFNSTDAGAGSNRRTGNFGYAATPIDNESRYVIASDGPDRVPNRTNISFYPGYSPSIFENPSSGYDIIRYDPTNGSISPGDVFRFSDFNAD